MRILTFLLTAFCFFQPQLPAQNPVRAGKDYALFFVVTDFEHWPDLPGTDQDPRALAAELESNYGFQKADFRLNPTKAQILAALRDYQKRQYGPQDQLLVFFSMHGYFDDAIGALIPRDGRLDDPSYESWLLHPALEAVLSKIPCPHTLLALDACYSGTFGAKYRDKPKRPAFEDAPTDCAGKVQAALQKTSRLYCTSGGKEHTPSKSQFAAKWLEALRTRNADGLLSFPELYAVLLEARPQPMYGDFRGHEPAGDFVFVQRSLCVSKPVDPIEADKAAWKTAKAANTVEGYVDYIKLYPRGLYVDDAGEAIKRIPAGGSAPQQQPASTPVNPQVDDRPDGFVSVPGGTFQMGSNDGGEDEKPVHAVTVGGFYLSKFEITNTEYCRFLNAKGNQTEGGVEWIELNGSYHQEKCRIRKQAGQFQVEPGYENYPVIYVSWYGAKAYCDWLTAETGLTHRLPTEAEWEYAARSGGKAQTYAGTSDENQLAAYANFCDRQCNESWKTSSQNDGYAYTAPVGKFKPNGLGLFDMSGNVWEWCADWYDANYYTQSPGNNPQGPASGTYRVLRGGSWDFVPAVCRVAYRYIGDPGYRYYGVGFRVARTP